MKCLLKYLVSSESTKFGSRARVARQADFKGSSENVEYSNQSARRSEANEITIRLFTPCTVTEFYRQQKETFEHLKL